MNNQSLNLEKNSLNIEENEKLLSKYKCRSFLILGAGAVTASLGATGVVSLFINHYDSFVMAFASCVAIYAGGDVMQRGINLFDESKKHQINSTDLCTESTVLTNTNEPPQREVRSMKKM